MSKVYRYLDLSHRFNKEMSLYPGSEPPVIEQITSVKEDGYNMMRYDITNHICTHLDAPGHMIENGKFIHEFDISKFQGIATVIDCRNQSSIGIECFEGKIDDIDTVLLYSGWEHYYESEKYYYEYPVLTIEACKYLIDKGIRIVGVDYFSVDPIDATKFSVHYELLGNDVILYENLCNLKDLIGKRFEFMGFPIQVEADGFPVRAVARIKEDK